MLDEHRCVAKAKSKVKQEPVEVVVADDSKALTVLTLDEKRELKKCEMIIKRGWDTFVDVGNALATIQRNQLYRAEHRTFEAYCRSRWQYGKSQAYRLIGAAEVIAHLSPIGDGLPLPMNEAQVRPLIGLEPEEQLRAWKSALEKAGESGVTARIVRDAVAPFQSAERKNSKPKNRGKSVVARALTHVDEALAALKDEDQARAQAALEKVREVLSAVP